MSIKITDVNIDSTEYEEMELRVLGVDHTGRKVYSLHGDPSKGDDRWVITINPLSDKQQDDQHFYLFCDLRANNVQETLIEQGFATLTGKSFLHPRFKVVCPELRLSDEAVAQLA